MTARRNRTKARLKQSPLVGLPDLEAVVRNVAPKATSVAIRKIGEQLKFAADLYRMEYLVREGDRLAKESANLSRGQLLRVADAASETILALRGLRPRALSAFTTSLGKLRGPLVKELGLALDASREALEQDRQRGSLEPDYALVVLAARVAELLRDELKVKASIYVPADLWAGKRGGGAYARVLAATLKVAGSPDILDLRRPMKAGIQLLKTAPTTKSDRRKR